jgi:transcription termination factor NusB
VIVDEYVTIASGYFEGNELGFIHSAMQQFVAALR